MPAIDAKDRYDFIDLIKGIGILLVVWGHTMIPRSVYIYSFHMPLFFFVSGYLHRDKPAGAYFAGKVRRLYFPYLVFCLLSWLFYAAVLVLRQRRFMLPAHAGKLISLLDGSARNGGNDAIWFLTCMLVVSGLYWAVRRVRQPGLRWVCIAAASAAGYALGVWNIALPFKIDAALTGVVFYHFGFEAKSRGALRYADKVRWYWLAAGLAVAEALHIAAAYLNVRVSGLPKVAMVSNNLGSYSLFYIAALAGVAVYTVVAYKLGRVGLVNYLGVNSLAILAYHKPLLYLSRLASGGVLYSGTRLSGLAASGIVVAAIVPLIIAGRKYAPWLIGVLPPIAAPTAVEKSPESQQ